MRKHHYLSGLLTFAEEAGALFGGQGEMVEVGSFVGESALVFARHFASVTCVDPWECHDDWSYDMAEVEREFDSRTAAVARITKLKAFSVEAARLFPDGSLDFVYIDALHEYEPVRSDIDAWLPKVRPGGAMGGHDYDWPSVRRAVDETFPRVELYADTSWLVPRV